MLLEEGMGVTGQRPGYLRLYQIAGALRQEMRKPGILPGTLEAELMVDPAASYTNSLNLYR